MSFKKKSPKTSEEVDMRIDEWHGNGETNMSLHEYLGWTWEQYSLYVSSGKIPEIT